MMVQQIINQNELLKSIRPQEIWRARQKKNLDIHKEVMSKENREEEMSADR